MHFTLQDVIFYKVLIFHGQRHAFSRSGIFSSINNPFAPVCEKRDKVHHKRHSIARRVQRA